MRKAILLFPLALAACGGSSEKGAVVSLFDSGASPSTISVAAGVQLQFTNEDFVNHQIVSNDCSELDSPVLTSAASFTATMGAGPRTCTFSCALNPGAAAYQGTVNVGASSAADAGYGNPYGP